MAVIVVAMKFARVRPILKQHQVLAAFEDIKIDELSQNSDFNIR
jgi:hypothetical protein